MAHLIYLVMNIMLNCLIQVKNYGTYDLSGDEYNVKLFDTSKKLWHYYCLTKVKLKIFDNLMSLNKTDLYLIRMVRQNLSLNAFH